MAEFDHPRPKRPHDTDADEEVYGLADDDSSDSGSDQDHEGEGLSSDQPGLLDELGLEESPRSGRDRNRARPPAPSAPPAAPLPRLWKVTPDPQPTPAPVPERKQAKPTPPEKSKPKAASVGHRREGGEIERAGRVRSRGDQEKERGASRARSQPPQKSPDRERDSEEASRKGLVEETPAFDTYEARQRVRTILGAALLGVVLLGGLYVVRTLLPGSSSDEIPNPDATVADDANPGPGPGPAPAPPPPSREAIEQEAKSLFERARESGRKGDAKLAISLLNRVVATYPNTAAAREAKEALARPAKNLPLFVDRPVVVAHASETKPPEPAPKPAAPNVVDATAPTTPTANAAEVGLVYPANPAEPSRGRPATSPPPTSPEPAPHVGRPLPPGFRSRPGTQAHESGWALEIVGDRDGATMVLVPGGEFLMGNDDGEQPERPAHRVKLSTYYVDQHEVTVRQFNLFEKEIGRRTDRVRALAREGSPVPTTADDEPVVMVSAKEAKDFATWARKRLPTEAQWEFAARGPDGRIHPWGNDPPQWPKKREYRQVEPVMSYANDVSPYGAFDMAGNAWEWTKDWYDSRYYVLVKNQVLSDPTGPTIVPRSLQLAVKGGSKTWTATKREGLKYEQRLPFLGFRCVLPVEGPGNAFETPAKPSAAGTQPIPGPAEHGGQPF